MSISKISNHYRTKQKPNHKTQTFRTLGPVSDLERHLPSNWWGSLFNSVYLKTDGDVIENYENTQNEVDLILRVSSLDENDPVLDLCCGQGRHSLELARRGFKRVVGIDRSRYLIRLARKRAQREGLSVEFREGDARKFRIDRNVYKCIILMGNSFGYFERKEDDAAVLNNVALTLEKQGNLVLDIVDGEWMKTHYEPRSWEWIDQNHFVCRERSLSSDGERLIAREVIVHAEKGVIVDQFYAERLYDRDTIAQLLKRLGYRAIRFHGQHRTLSTRNQDLGLMSHRIVLSAVSPYKSAKKLASKTNGKSLKVTVLLGDPTLPDRVKVDGQFNELDIETVDRMKKSLSELTDYRLEYIDSHKNLISTFIQNRPEFVFNLCDEGYNNDAFKELHIPAMLEMLEIPYTGAGPTCLGICYNKGIIGSIADSLDIPTPLQTYLDSSDVVATIPATFPALIKPNFGDSSIGITKEAVVTDHNQLLGYLDWLKQTMNDQPILIQEFLPGPEYSVGIVGNPGLSYQVLPILEVDYSELEPQLPHILGYESKWIADSPYFNQVKYRKAHISEDMKRTLIDYSNILFERLECRDYARFDFRTDSNGVIKLLEVNPNPGWCWDGKLNMMAGFAGLSYSALLRSIIEAARERVFLSKLSINSSNDAINTCEQKITEPLEQDSISS